MDDNTPTGSRSRWTPGRLPRRLRRRRNRPTRASARAPLRHPSGARVGARASPPRRRRPRRAPAEEGREEEGREEEDRQAEDAAPQDREEDRRKAGRSGPGRARQARRAAAARSNRDGRLDEGRTRNVRLLLSREGSPSSGRRRRAPCARGTCGRSSSDAVRGDERVRVDVAVRDERKALRTLSGVWWNVDLMVSSW
jgi:hypothetical protein